MEFDLQGPDAGRAYALLASVVVPRPIALVTSLDDVGRVNAAPFSFFNLVGSRPPTIALGIGDRDDGTPKDSRANLARLGEFVVNLVDESLAVVMNVCAVDFPSGVSEIDQAGVTLVPSVKVQVPRIAESRGQLECRLHSLVTVGANRIVLAEVVHLHIQDAYLDAERGRVHTDQLGLIGRMHGGGWYARTSDLFDLPRMTYSEWEDRQADDQGGK